MTGLTEGLAELVQRPAATSATVARLAERLDRVESRLERPSRRTSVGRVAVQVRRSLGRP